MKFDEMLHGIRWGLQHWRVINALTYRQREVRMCQNLIMTTDKLIDLHVHESHLECEEQDCMLM